VLALNSCSAATRYALAVVTLLAVIAGSQVFGIWGAILAAPTAGLIQALLGAYWQYYQKTRTEEFPLQQLEEKANPQ
jgi:predicted PurR-regulated permease PerM